MSALQLTVCWLHCIIYHILDLALCLRFDLFPAEKFQHILSSFREFDLSCYRTEYMSVSNHDHGFIFPKSLTYEYMLPLGFKSICAFCQHRILFSYLCQHPIMSYQFFIFPAPRICSSVIWIFISLYACFVTIVQARHTRQHILDQWQDFHPVLSKPHLVIRDSIILLIVFAETMLWSEVSSIPASARRITQYSQRPCSVMASYQVQSAIEILRRIILCQAVQSSHCSLRIASAQHVIHQKITNRVIHSWIQLIAHEVATLHIVTHLIAGIFPDFSHQKSFRISLFNSLPDTCNKVIR